MKQIIAVSVLALGVVHGAQAQKADVSQPKQREEVVLKARAFQAARGVEITLPEQLANPFFPEQAVTIKEPEETPSVALVQAIEESELLARLAAQIPVSGTANLGGEPLAAFGSKRLKAGDVVRISFEGKPYELIIEKWAPLPSRLKEAT